jgi:hypothetical protein
MLYIYARYVTFPSLLGGLLDGRVVLGDCRYFFIQERKRKNRNEFDRDSEWEGSDTPHGFMLVFFLINFFEIRTVRADDSTRLPSAEMNLGSGEGEPERQQTAKYFFFPLLYSFFYY